MRALLCLVVIALCNGCIFLTGAFRAECGDGFLQDEETCDDGSLANGDGCDDKCRLEDPPVGCGDGIRQPEEQCDDGNLANGDGCDAFCTVETNGIAAIVVTPVADASLLDPADSDVLRVYAGLAPNQGLNGFLLEGVGAADDDAFPAETIVVCWETLAGDPVTTPFAGNIEIVDAVTATPLATALEPDANGCVPLEFADFELAVGDVLALAFTGDIAAVTAGSLASGEEQVLRVVSITDVSGDAVAVLDTTPSAPRRAFAGIVTSELQDVAGATLANAVPETVAAKISSQSLGSAGNQLQRIVVDVNIETAGAASFNGAFLEIGGTAVTTSFGCTPAAGFELCLGFAFDVPGQEQVLAPSETRVYDLFIADTNGIQVGDRFTFALREGTQVAPADGYLYTDVDGDHIGQGLVSGEADITTP